MSTSMKIIFVVVLILLIILSAVFSAAETAYTSLSRTKIDMMLKRQKRSAKLIKKHYHNFGWTLATILISNSVVNILAASLTTLLLTKLMGESGLVTLISTAVITPIVVIFGEIGPKLLAKRYPYKYLTVAAYFIEILNWVLSPFTYPLSKITLQSKVTNSETELKQLISLATNEGVLELQEATLAQKALDLDSLPVSKVMIRKSKIQYLENHTTVKDAKKQFAFTTLSRMPLMVAGKFTGMILLKDIILEADEAKVESFVKPVIFISKNIIVTKALEKMRLSRTQIALVTESQKSKVVLGLITVEDIIEELVGEIYDEHDVNPSVREIAHFKWVARGNVEIKELELATKIKFDSAENIQLKQWIMEKSHKRIKRGLKVIYLKRNVFKVIVNHKNQEPLIEITRKLGK